MASILACQPPYVRDAIISYECVCVYTTGWFALYAYDVAKSVRVRVHPCAIFTQEDCRKLLVVVFVVAVHIAHFISIRVQYKYTHFNMRP